jgi:DUSP domain
MNLKENLVEHFDFEAVSPAVWKYIYSWYSADWCIMRYLKRDKMNPLGAILDLYPENSIPGLVVIDQTSEEFSVDQNGGERGTLNRVRTVDYQEFDQP